MEARKFLGISYLRTRFVAGMFSKGDSLISTRGVYGKALTSGDISTAGDPISKS